jgi:hypothetical protein
VIFVLAAMVAGTFAGTGCQRTVPPMVERLNNTPLVVDPAMQRREWEPSVAYYGNGDTVAGGTGYMFHTHETIPPAALRVVDPMMAATNIALLPIGVFVNSPFEKQQYQGAVIPPTHSGNPPLP